MPTGVLWRDEEPVDQMIRRLRDAAGKSQKGLAADLSALADGTTLERGAVQRWETRKRIPIPYWRERLCVVLGVPPEVMDRACAVAKASRALSKAKTASVGAKSRSAAGRESRASGSGAPVEDASRTAPAHVLSASRPSTKEPRAPRSVNMSDVRVIRGMLGSLTASDHQFGGGRARGHAVDYLDSVVRPLSHAHGADTVRQELLTVSAEFALRVAWMHFDIGQISASRRFLGMAMSLAHETDDLTLFGWVLAMRGLQEVWLNNATTALAHTGAAVAMSTHAPPLARSFILGKHALALSTAGDRDATTRALADVRRSFERAGSAREPAWTHIYDWGYLRDEEGHCYRNVGLGGLAVAAEDEAMGIRGQDGYARFRAFSLGVRAVGLAQDGQIDHACAVGLDLVGMAGQFASQRVDSRLREVLRVLSVAADHRAVKELTEAARSLLSTASDRA